MNKVKGARHPTDPDLLRHRPGSQQYNDQSTRVHTPYLQKAGGGFV